MLKYRNRCEGFVGDPLLEARAEVLDLWNYAGEARRQKLFRSGLVGWCHYAALRACALIAWRLL